MKAHANKRDSQLKRFWLHMTDFGRPTIHIGASCLGQKKFWLLQPRGSAQANAAVMVKFLDLWGWDVVSKNVLESLLANSLIFLTFISFIYVIVVNFPP